MSQTHNETNGKEIKWLEKFSQDMDEAEPEFIDAMPIEDVRAELRSSGTNVEEFHERIAKTLGIEKLKTEDDLADIPKKDFYEWWADLFIRLSPLKVAAVVCVPLFLTLLLLLQPYLKPEVKILIAQSYKTINAKEIPLNDHKLNKIFEFQWEKKSRLLAFSSSDRHGDAYRAFGAGLSWGRQFLSKGRKKTPVYEFLSPGWPDNSDTELDKWSDKPQWASYFWMGQSCFVIEVALCLPDSEVSKNFWNQQILVLDKILKDFEERAKKAEDDVEFVKSRLVSVKSLLENMDRGSPERSQRRKISEELDSLRFHLSPRYIPQTEKN